MKKRLVSIIVPAHNEEGNIKKCVSSIRKSCRKMKYEIIIVDDCSKDKTGKISDTLSKKSRNIRVVHRTMPNGFGRAVKSGLKESRGDVVVLVMADLSDDTNTIPKMIDKLEQGYDIAVGSRFVEGGRLVDYPKIKYMAHRTYSSVVGFFFWRNIKDFSNAFKAYKKHALRGFEIKSDGFEITSEMILKSIAVNNSKVIEVPTTWRNRTSGRAKFTGLYKQGVRYGYVLLSSLALKMRR